MPRPEDRGPARQLSTDALVRRIAYLSRRVADSALPEANRLREHGFLVAATAELGRRI